MLSGTISKSAVFMMHILNEITSLMSPLAMIPDLIPILDNPNERFKISYIPMQYHLVRSNCIYYTGSILSFLCDYNGLQILLKVLQIISHHPTVTVALVCC